MLLSSTPPNNSNLFKGHHLPPCVPTNCGWEITSPTTDIDDPFERAPVPSQCVDYLTHQWEFEDLALSWKAVSRHSDTSLNCSRLENASWRIWAKQRKNIPTLNPEKLNWYKENDITWLYGPLLKNKNPSLTSSAPVSKSPSFVNAIPTQLKPALKKLTPLNTDLFKEKPKKKTKLRFNHRVEQFIITDNQKDLRMVKKMEPTIIKNEEEDLIILKQVDTSLFNEDDELDSFLSYKASQASRIYPKEMNGDPDLIQRCVQAVTTTYEVVCWARNLLF
ncbi:hypothetical protein K502DRAFT_323038 [Neoconidiobolus thromboides FSU 785]|nr:hypothetical protein K502DRAFT_323038 [Neoconidiobolus thromboides FSU 785]